MRGRLGMMSSKIRPYGKHLTFDSYKNCIYLSNRPVRGSSRSLIYIRVEPKQSVSKIRARGVCVCVCVCVCGCVWVCVGV
jgi:hypothetical protein